MSWVGEWVGRRQKAAAGQNEQGVLLVCELAFDWSKRLTGDVGLNVMSKNMRARHFAVAGRDAPCYRDCQGLGYSLLIGCWLTMLS